LAIEARRKRKTGVKEGFLGMRRRVYSGKE
jgi:hypothetical protein